MTRTGSSSAARRGKVRRFVDRHQMVVFLALTLLVSWAFVIPADGGLIPYGPLVAALVVLGTVGGRPAVGGLWDQMRRWRVRWTWYLAGPGILLALHLATLAASVALGAQIVAPAHPGTTVAYLGGTFLPLLLLGGQWEEPGWMGYAQRRFLDRFLPSVLRATFAVGVIRMFWHTPLLAYGTIPWFDFVFGMIALQVLLTWLYYSSSGSLLIVMIAHLFSNVWMATFRPLFPPADQGRYWLIFIVLETLVALVLLGVTRGRLGYRQGSPVSATPGDEIRA